MSSLRTITRNVFSNAAGYAVHVIVSFLLTPYVIDTLGKPAYGLWVLIVSCTGYYGLLDLGIRSPVGQYATRYWAKNDMPGVNRTINTALGLTSAFAAVLFLLTGALAWLAPHLFNVPGEDVATSRLVFVIMGCGIAVNFPLLVFGCATYARQRFDIANAIGIVERLVSAAGYVYVLNQGHGIVGIAVVTTVTNIVAGLVRMAVAFRLLPGLRLSRRLFARNSVQELWRFGVFNVLINAADQIVLNSDALVIGIALSTVANAHYNPAVILIGSFLGLVNSIAWSLTPYATSCDARGDAEALRRLWLTGTRVITIVAALLGGGLIFAGEDFLRLWIGAEFTSGAEWTSTATILSILAAAAILRSALTCGKQILFGLREVRFLAFVSFFEAFGNLALSLALVWWFGLVGVAVGTLVSITLVQLSLQPRYLAQRLTTPLGRFVRLAPLGGIVVLVTMGMFAWLFDRLLTVADWGEFFGKAFALAIPAAIAGAALGTSLQEKQKVWARLRGRPMGR